jgi:hypothetical protein
MNAARETVPVTIFQIANRFSFLIPALLVFIGVGLLLARRQARWPLWTLWGGALVLLLVFLLATGQRTTVRYDTPENIRQALATAEQPTLVEFFSNH